MQRTDLLAQLSETYTDINEAHDRSIEVDFILKYWNIFVDTKGILYDALRGMHDVTGNDLLSFIGLAEHAVVEKVKEVDLLNFCYSAPKSKLMNKTLSIIKEKQDATCFYVVGKTKAVVITNQYKLAPENTFNHILPSAGVLNNMYWARVDDVKDTLRLWV